MRKAFTMDNNEKDIQRINLIGLLDNFLREAKRLISLAIVLMVVFAGGVSLQQYATYSPVYEASASFTVRVANPMYASVHTYNTATATQMAETFPHILTSGVLHERVRKYLNVSYVPPINADVLKSSNIFTLRVRDGNPEYAYKVLNAVIACYPDVADFVVGPTVMVLLDETGIPTTPVNAFSLPASIQRGALIGFALWAVFVLIMALTKTTVRTEDDLKNLLNFNCLGQIPSTKAPAKHLCPLLYEVRDRSGFGEAVRLLRLRVEKEMADHERRILLVSSAIPGEGKTTISVNLSMSLAMKGHKVLLIDCDTRNPSVARTLRMKNQRGFAEYISGDISARGLIQDTRVENLFIIAGGVKGKENHSDILSSKRASQLISSVGNVYDYVILDTPPCSLLADASELAEVADCALLVIRQDFASRNQILDGVQGLVDSGLPFAGCVLNGIETSIAYSGTNDYGYGYGSSYGSGYGSARGSHAK